MPASDEEVEETLAENIAINNGWGPKEFLKDKNGKVTGVVFKKCLSVFDASGKFAPKYDENDTMEVEADYVITSIGQCIDWGGLLEGENMEFVHGNYPKADPFTYQTSVPDIFVGGDVYHGPSFVVNAIGEGHEAAESLHRFVRPTCSSLTLSREHRHFFEFDKLRRLRRRPGRLHRLRYLHHEVLLRRHPSRENASRSLEHGPV